MVSDRLLQRLGWGDPIGGIWFVGYREGSIHDLNDLDWLPNLEYLNRNPWSTCIKMTVRPEKSLIGFVESAIASSVSKTNHIAIDYEFSALWQPNSSTCHMNLLPLGKPGSDEYDDDYIMKFGFQSRSDFYERVFKERYPLVQKQIELCHPKAIICFGKQWWPEYEKVFCTGVDLPHSDTLSRTKIYNDKRLILVNHFSNGNITQYDRLEIVKCLRKWKVSIP